VFELARGMPRNVSAVRAGFPDRIASGVALGLVLQEDRGARDTGSGADSGVIAASGKSPARFPLDASPLSD